jgi:hypothetical protein
VSCSEGPATGARSHRPRRQPYALGVAASQPGDQTRLAFCALHSATTLPRARAVPRPHNAHAAQDERDKEASRRGKATNGPPLSNASGMTVSASDASTAPPARPSTTDRTSSLSGSASTRPATTAAASNRPQATHGQIAVLASALLCASRPPLRAPRGGWRGRSRPAGQRRCLRSTMCPAPGSRAPGRA